MKTAGHSKGFPKVRGTFVGVPTRIVFGGPYWGSPILGNYHSKVVPMNDQNDVYKDRPAQIKILTLLLHKALSQKGKSPFDLPQVM